MTDSASQMFDVLVRTTTALSLAGCCGWLFLKLFRARSARTHRFVWAAVLVQGWLFWRILLPLLPADESPAASGSPHSAVTLPDSTRLQNADVSIPFDAAINATSNLKPADSRRPDQTLPLPEVAKDDESSSNPFPLIPILMGVWGFGILAIVSRFILRYVQFLRRLAASRPAPRKWSDEWQATLNDAGLKANIPIVVHPAGPLLCRVPGGYRLLVPPEFWNGLSPNRRRSVLLHEIAHYRRGDVWKSLLARLLLLPHWFNPFAWLAVRRFDECAEWACDDAVCGQHSQHVAEYARTLLDLTAVEHPTAAYSPGAGGRCLADRIRRIFNPLSTEDRLMKRISLFTLVVCSSLLGLIRVGSADVEHSAVAASVNPVAFTDDETQAFDENAPESVPPKPTDADLAQADATSSRSANRSRPSQRKYKIEEALIDMNYIFKNLPEFQRMRKQLKKEISASDTESKKRVHAIQRAKNGGKNPDEMKRLIKEFNDFRQARQKQFLQKEARVYHTVYTRVQTEVARLAKEKDIRIVRRLKSPIMAKRRPVDPKAIIRKINQEVVYQADDRVDITKEILKRLVAADRGNATDSTDATDGSANETQKKPADSSSSRF